ncbi:site-2 protease family protein [Curtobacterium sp. MCBD17_019]|uniref:site-2 protease family protein n=1 Tax=Curtobacterium sp. MCBD17_019 TaxID=2175669 RepID=UPI0011B73AED|nr:site-2 protease family protein [Curtobacterium sp. MCBD17_019]
MSDAGTARHLRLADGVTRSVATDTRILLRTPDGRFVAVPPGASPIIGELERGCSFERLAELVRVVGDGRAAEAALTEFIDALRKSGLIAGASSARSRTDRFLARAGADFFARLPVPVDIDRVATMAARPMRRVSAGALLLVSVILATTGVAAGFATAVSHRDELARPPADAVVVVIALVLLQLGAHETAHAVALRTQGARVREIGVGLLYYFVPVAYVDRTEAYSVRSRPGLVLIALAGPVLDSALIGVAAVVALVVGHDAHRVLVLYVTAELILLVVNCNPLFRSDGYHAIEAAFGALNMRARAFTIVTNAVLRRAQPAYVRAMTRMRRIGLAVYAVGSVLYLIAMSWHLAHAILLVVLGARS